MGLRPVKGQILDLKSFEGLMPKKLSDFRFFFSILKTIPLIIFVQLRGLSIRFRCFSILKKTLSEIKNKNANETMRFIFV